MIPDVFSHNATDNSLDSASEADSVNDSDDNSGNDTILDDEEEQELPAEYYLQEAECLDVSRLRQKRYSPWTQDKLDKTEILGSVRHCCFSTLTLVLTDSLSRFCRDGNYDPVECFHWLSDSEETVRFLKALFSW